MSMWKESEEGIITFLKTAKLLISCRNYILFDKKVKGVFEEENNIVNIDGDECKLTYEEKRCIWKKYISNTDISKEDFSNVLKTETCFPLLCKLYSGNIKNRKEGYNFFKEPMKVVEEQIKYFRTWDKGKYCAIALLVLFNNNFCTYDVLGNEFSEKKF